VGPIPTTISMGAAAVTDGGLDPDWIVEAADRALYRAKQAGRNRIEVAEFGGCSARNLEAV
jgi:diguanylate cyclase (GGDEF)-like protein